MALISWWLSKFLVKVDYAGMVNLIVGKKIIPEYLQNQATAESITKEALEIINSSTKQQQIKSELYGVQQSLRGEGASRRAAKQIISMI